MGWRTNLTLVRVFPDRGRHDLFERVVTADQLAEDGVIEIQELGHLGDGFRRSGAGRVERRDEELGIGSVVAAIGHRQQSQAVERERRIELVGEQLAGVAAAVVASLGDEAVEHAEEGQPVVVSLVD